MFPSSEEFYLLNKEKCHLLRNIVGKAILLDLVCSSFSAAGWWAFLFLCRNLRMGRNLTSAECL